MPDSKPHAPSSLPSLDQAWSYLSSAGWLAEIDAEHRPRLRAIARHRSHAAGEYLYRPGDTPDGVYGLVTGTLDLLIPRLDGEEYPVHRARAGFWVGDLALFARQRRLVGVCASTPSTTVYLPQDQLRQLVAAHPGLVGEFYKLTHANVGTALRLLGMLSVAGAENRVALRLLMEADITRPDDDGWILLSQESLAAMVALSQQSVRRALRSLERRGLVEVGYGKLRLTDRKALAALCHYLTDEDDTKRKSAKRR